MRRTSASSVGVTQRGRLSKVRASQFGIQKKGKQAKRRCRPRKGERKSAKGRSHHEKHRPPRPRYDNHSDGEGETMEKQIVLAGVDRAMETGMKHEEALTRLPNRAQQCRGPLKEIVLF